MRELVLVMNPVVAAARRDSGECWKAVSSRIVYSRVKQSASSATEAEEQMGLSVVSDHLPFTTSIEGCVL